MSGGAHYMKKDFEEPILEIMTFAFEEILNQSNWGDIDFFQNVSPIEKPE